jgi:hypothetical protein
MIVLDRPQIRVVRRRKYAMCMPDNYDKNANTYSQYLIFINVDICRPVKYCVGP